MMKYVGSDGIVNLELPGPLRSPWRWCVVAVGFTMSLVGLTLVVGWDGDVFSLLVGLGTLALGGWFVFSSWRSGVFVDEKCVVERGMAGVSERMAWDDVAEVEIGRGASILPSRTVVLVGKGGVDDVVLNSLSWYSFRPRRTPRRVAEFQRIASVIMKEND